MTINQRCKPRELEKKVVILRVIKSLTSVFVHRLCRIVRNTQLLNTIVFSDFLDPVKQRYYIKKMRLISFKDYINGHKKHSRVKTIQHQNFRIYLKTIRKEHALSHRDLIVIRCFSGHGHGSRCTHFDSKIDNGSNPVLSLTAEMK